MKIGVISDTHGFLHPHALETFRDVEMIFHAGDVGNLSVLQELNAIAPTYAVYGNMDMGIVRNKIKDRIVLEVNGRRIGIAHGGGSPHDIIQRLSAMFESDKVDIIVFGHTHEPFNEKIGKIFFFNPGYGRTGVGILKIQNNGEYETELIKF